MRYILGGGLNGLIMAYYNPDFKVIDIKPPKAKDHWTPETRDVMVQLHDTKENRILLDDLKIAYSPKVRDIKYFFNGKIYDSCPEPLVTEYVLKKLGNNKHMLTEDRTLTQASSRFKVLNCNLETVYRVLRKSVEDRIIECDNINGIKSSHIVVDRGTAYSYELLVSTLPAPVFWEKWAGVKPDKLELEFLSSTFLVEKEPPGGVSKDDDFGLMYFVDDRPYHRVSHMSPDKYIYEFTGIHETFPNSSIQRLAQFKTCPHNVPPPNVLFAGRVATWRHWWKIEHTVKMARSRFALEQMWNRQAFFETHFLDFDRPTSELIGDTIYFITCVQEELHEMLRELNCKKWKDQKIKVDRERVLEEYIDAFKFLLSIGSLWGFSIEEISDMFHKKSKKVEEEFFDGELLG